MPPSFFLVEMRMCGCFVRAIWINYNFDPEEPETNNNNKKKKRELVVIACMVKYYHMLNFNLV